MIKNNRKGFTIVELVIVIAVIAILAGVLIPTFSGIVTKANASKALQEARNLYNEYLIEVDGQPAAKVFVQGGDQYVLYQGGAFDEESPFEDLTYTAGDVIVTKNGATVTIKTVCADNMHDYGDAGAATHCEKCGKAKS